MNIKQTETDVKAIKEVIKRANPTIEEIEAWTRIINIISGVYRRAVLDNILSGKRLDREK